MTRRKSAFQMSAEDQQRFIDAVTRLNSGNAPTPYGQFVGMHVDMRHNMHSMGSASGRERFLPWHRDFLLKFEQALQAIEPEVYVPYWPWSRRPEIPAWIAAFTPTVQVPAVMNMPPQQLTGSRRFHPETVPTGAQIASLTGAQSWDYSRFTSQLEAYHNGVHASVGGIMNNTMYSPVDPIFWLHHAEIDRIWATWQATPANAGKRPQLAGASDILDPWTETTEQVNDIAALGVEYVSEQNNA